MGARRGLPPYNPPMPILSWLSRDDDIKAAASVPYRLLEAVPEHDGGGSDDRSENLLIQGDNLHALKALLPYYAGRVKCIFIDPPYNTRQDFAHYDDNLEHTQWLEMMYPRLEVLRALLADDGSIWAIIDDDEGHYLKVIMDEIFGRANFVANVVWQKRTSPDARLGLGPAQDYILVYGAGGQSMKFNKIEISEKQKKRYKNPDKDPRGPWVSSDYSAQGYRPRQMYVIKTPAGVEHKPPAGMCWKNVESVFLGLVKDNRIWFGKDGKGVPRRKNFLSETAGISAWTWWSNNEVGHNQEAKKEVNALFGAEDGFDTPKPERLIQRVLQLATNEGDWVLDSFLGSGTTAAVAHKMGRRWIGIEMGDHAVTHCIPRLNAVIAGEQGGISKAVDWKGGGGFGFYQLGAEVFTAAGKINPDIVFPTLAAHVWFCETGTPWSGTAQGAFLGAHDGSGYALLYNGVLGDRRVNGGNVLTHQTLSAIRQAARAFAGQLVIYAAANRFGEDFLKRENIVFKQTPYEIEVR